MYQQTLQPIRDKDAYSKELSKLLSYDLFQLIYKPLIDLLTGDAKENSKASLDVLIQAFATRKIHYDNGFVYGSFNAAIGKALRELGAVFNHTRKAYKLDLSRLPPELRDAIARGSSAEKEAIDKMLKKVQELTATNIIIPGTEDISKRTLADLHKQFEKLTPADLEIPVQMGQAQEEFIREDYTNNVHLEINGLAQEAVARLRYRVEEEVGKGTRAENLKDILFAEHGVMANRARFIARNETSLFVAKYRRTRYEDAGLNKYQWSTSNDDRVREDHRELNGRIFSWDSPPIVDKATGARANPGEYYNCRCVALPVILVGGKNILETEEHRALHK